jgi:hypothetical protein
MKRYPPHSSQTGLGPAALLALAMALFLFFVLSSAAGGQGGIDSLDRPLGAPVGLDQ